MRSERHLIEYVERPVDRVENEEANGEDDAAISVDYVHISDLRH